MLERQAAVQRVDDVARVVRESARDAERVEIGRWLVTRLLGRQHEPRLLSHRLGADAGVADRAQIPHEPPIGDALRTVVAAEDRPDGIVAGPTAAPGDDAIGRGDHHAEDPRAIGPGPRKAQRLPAGRIGGADDGALVTRTGTGATERLCHSAVAMAPPARFVIVVGSRRSATP